MSWYLYIHPVIHCLIHIPALYSAFSCNDPMINGKPEMVGSTHSCRKGMLFALKLDLDESVLSCYCDGVLTAKLKGLPKDVELFPAAYLGGHPDPMVFTTCFKE